MTSDDFPTFTGREQRSRSRGIRAIASSERSADIFGHLPAGFVWSTVLPADHDESAAHRHVVHERSPISLCGINTVPRLWKVNRSKPHCPDCVRVLDTEDLDSFEIDRRLTIARVGTATGGTATRVTDHVNGPKRLLRRHFDEDVADAIATLHKAGMLRFSEEHVMADKDGIFESVDGTCLRDSDQASERLLSRLAITTRWVEPDGAPYRPGTEPAAATPAAQEWEPEDTEF
ncbi:hypothetical protein [Nocardioides pakistanensis]